MKRKIFATALSLVLIFTACIGVSAQTDSSNINENPVIQTGNIDSNTARSANSSIVSNGIYRIRNVGSGKYLNLHYGVDANSTNVYQWTYDGSTEQKWRVAYNSGTDSYQFYSMSSSGGTNRLLDISRGGSHLINGLNAQLWTPTDTLSHEMQIIHVSTDKYKICMKGNTNLCLTAYGNSNGTANGTSATSAGNVFISTYTGDGYQVWEFESTGENVSIGAGGFLDSVSSTAISGWAWRSDLPNSPINVHIYISNTTTGDQYIRGVIANIYRPDLESAGYGNGCHGFSYPIDWEDFPSGNYSITAYAIGSSTNPPLVGNPMAYTWDLGYKGYAVYRGITKDIVIVDNVRINWHAGFMNKPFANQTDSVIHVLDDNSTAVRTDSWSRFIAGEAYHGIYKPKTEISEDDRIKVINLARELADLEIDYVLTTQMEANIPENISKIEPDNITALRCDGLIEYCYEYYGYKIYGNNNNWDISKANPDNLSHHSVLGIRPKNQAEDYMTLISTSVPNQ